MLKKEILWILLICLCIKQLFSVYEVSTVSLNVLIRVLPILMLDCKSVKSISFISLIYIIGVPFCTNGVLYFLPLFFAAYALRNINYIYITKIFLITQLLMLSCQYILVMSGIGIVEENILIKDQTTVVAYDFGFGNPNSFAVIVFYIICYLYLICYKKNKVPLFVIVLLSSILLYIYTGSRTILLSCIFLILSFIICLFPLLKKWIFSNVIFILVPAAVGITLLFSNYFADNEELNQLLSGRIAIASLLLESLSSPIQAIFGQPITDDVPTDNAFIYMLVRLGLVGISVFFYQYVKIIRLKNQLSVSVMSVLLVIIVSGIGEASWVHMGYAGSFFFWILLVNRTTIQNRKIVKDEL